MSSAAFSEHAPASSLTSRFLSHFDIHQAVSPELLDDAYRLRYSVLCREFALPLPSHNGRERDQFDRQARHCVLVHRRTNRCAGYIRLLVPYARESGMDLPFIDHLNRDDGAGLLHPSQLAPGSFCEISRCVVAAPFRQRIGERLSPQGQLSTRTQLSSTRKSAESDPKQPNTGQDEEQRLLPSVALGLHMAALSFFLRENRGLIFMVGGLPTILRLAQMGVYFTRVSDPPPGASKDAVYFATRDSLLLDLEQLPPHYLQLFKTIDEHLLAAS